MSSAPESRLCINGQERRFAGPPPATVADLCVALGLDPGRVVAEVDGRVTASAAFATTPLADGSRVELVHFVGGGD